MIHDLKDVGEAVEKLRRLRRDLPENEIRSALDATLLRLAGHVEGIVAEDERLKSRRDAEQLAMRSSPDDFKLRSKWILDGTLQRVIELILSGVAAADAWKQSLTSK